jgi:predicted Zn-dependent protease
VTAVTADATSLGTAVAGLPVILAQTNYSRAFETNADSFAFKLLKEKGRSPEAFATIMEKLAARRGGRMAAFSYLSSHPVTEERTAKDRHAAR